MRIIGGEHSYEHEVLAKLTAMAKELQVRQKYERISSYYPEDGPLSYKNYPKHYEFFEAGKLYRERCALAANRIGKTEGMGGFELTCHLTGRYPDWWPGYRFDRPIRAWAAGSTGQTVRDILQEKLVGPVGSEGTGLIPRNCLINWKRKAGNVPDSYETINVRHEPTGGTSRLTLKSYDQKRKSFEGVEQDVILLDEECPVDIYGECVIRTMTTRGLVMLTFTPLLGLSEVVLMFLKEGKLPKKDEMQDRFVVNATWDDAPHLTEEAKKEMLAATEPHLREARSKGIPHLGAGAIYPILEEKILVEPFEMPAYWPRAYGMDVGWNRTAAIFAAWDRDSDIVYLYSEHYLGHAEPPIHATSILARGKWIPGVIDPSARGRNVADGSHLLEEYQGYGLDVWPADNALEAGIHAVWTRLSTGRLKVFSSLSNWLMEYRLYRRDENGQVARNQRDHLMDATRYLITSGMDLAITEPTGPEFQSFYRAKPRRSRVAGY